MGTSSSKETSSWHRNLDDDVGFVDEQSRRSGSPPIARVVVLGSTGAGKSAATVAMVTHNFVEEYDPLIEDSYRKSMVFEDVAMLWEILDTVTRGALPGDVDVETFTEGTEKAICEWRAAAIVVFSLANRESFEHAGRVLHHLCELMTEVPYRAPVVLAGSHADLDPGEYEVDLGEAEELARSFNCGWLPFSSKSIDAPHATEMGIVYAEELFMEVMRRFTRHDFLTQRSHMVKSANKS